MPRILYVEDNEDNIYMLARRLKRSGFDVLIARNGQQGISLARSEAPDLILMDLKLPVLDGWEATRRLKSDPQTARIPVIALSASAMNADAESAFDAGCNDFALKPVDFAQLLDKIDAQLGSASRPTP